MRMHARMDKPDLMERKEKLKKTVDRKGEFMYNTFRA